MQAPIAGGGTQLAFENAGDNPSWPGAVFKEANPPIPGSKPISSPEAGGIGGSAFDQVGNALLDMMHAPTNASESYTGTQIPKTYSLPAYGGTQVTEGVTAFLLDRLNRGLKNETSKGEIDESGGMLLGLFNRAITQARRALPENPTAADYDKTYGGGFYDFKFAPPAKPGDSPRVVGVRLPGDGFSDPGPWWGTSAPTSTPEVPETSPTPTTNDGERPLTDTTEPKSSKQTLLPRSGSLNDDYDETDFRAGLAAGLSDQAALARAKNIAQRKRDTLNNTQSTNEEYDKYRFLDLMNLGYTPQSAQRAARKKYIQDKSGIKNEPIVVGSSFDEGDEKQIYNVQGDETKLLAFSRSASPDYARWELTNEIRSLDIVRSNGVPTVPHDGLRIIDGRPAILMTRIPDAISVKPSRPIDAEVSERLGAASVDDLEKMQTFLQTHSTSDFQLLINGHGRIFVNDPGTVHSEPSSGPVVGMIRNLLEIARKNAARRE